VTKRKRDLSRLQVGRILKKKKGNTHEVGNVPKNGHQFAPADAGVPKIRAGARRKNKEKRK